MKTINLPSDISEIIDIVDEKTSPISIFIYGSRARGDFKKDSDYEVGVVFLSDKRWERVQLANLHSNENINIYSFALEDIQDYKIDAPFPKAVYLRELIDESITVKGTTIIQKLELPEIKLSDLLEVITFEIAYDLGSLLSARRNDLITASTQFTKAILYAVRALIILEIGNFPLTYNDIYAQSKKLGFLDKNSTEVIDHAYNVRKGEMINLELIYKSLKFLNKIVYERVKSQLKNQDKVILPGHKFYQ